MDFPAKIDDAADFLAHSLKDARTASVEDRLARCASVEQKQDALVSLGQNEFQRNLVRSTVEAVAQYLREADVRDERAWHDVFMAINRLRHGAHR
jgi:hypothetical protein